MSQTIQNKIRHRTNVARAHSDAIVGRASTLMVKEGPVYDGRAGELFPIILKNVILTFLTLGIYRFWAKTRMRRYFLSRVAFLGDRLEYTGTGKELFFGFLIVLAVLVPVSITYQFLEQFALSHGTSAVAAVTGGYLLLFYFLYYFATYRAQRYRLSRTTWRGIRGGQQGSALWYAAQAMGWSLVVLVTAGLAYPLMRLNLIRYKINNAGFGDERFRFEGSAARLFVAWLVPWLGIAAVILPAIFFAIVANEYGISSQTKTVPPELMATYKSLVPFAGAGVVVFLLGQFWYRAAEVRHFSGHTQFDELRFDSSLRGIQIFLPYVMYWTALVLVIAALFAAAAGLGFVSLMGGQTGNIGQAAGIVSIVIIVFGVFMVGGILQPLIVQNLLIRVFCKQLTMQGSFSPDRLFQNQLAIPRRGEGLADALDVDAF